MVCDSCREFIREEAGECIDDETVEAIALSMGADIADHLCDAVETPPMECRCACLGTKYRGEPQAAPNII